MTPALNKKILLPYQAKAINDPATVKVYEKSRRIGMSFVEAGDSALTASTQGVGGMDVWYIGYNKDMAKEFIADTAFWAKIYEKAASEVEETVLDEDKDITAFVIKFASGHKVTALSSRPRNLRAKQGKVIIDEAAFHDDLPGLLKAVMALKIWGGKVVIISTHNGEDSDFNELIKDIRAGKKNYSLHRITFDQAVEQGLGRKIFEKLHRQWTPEAEKEWYAETLADYGDDADEELFCVPSQGSGVYLSRALIEACMTREIPVYRWECKSGFAELAELLRRATTNDWLQEHLAGPLEALNPNLQSFFGEDFGRSGDLTVIVPLQLQPNLTRRAPFVVELRNVPFEQQKQILFFIGDRLPKLRGGKLDARGNGQYLAEVAMQRWGKGTIEEVMLSEKWYRENMPRYKAAFEDRTIILPADSDIVDDHRLLKMIKGVARIPEGKRTADTKGKQRHGDAAIAGALAYAASVSSGPAAADVGSDVDKNVYQPQRPSRIWDHRAAPGAM